MRRDSRLSDVLHVLLHMADQSGPMTSESLATMLNSNPVVVRRILGGLRDRGLVQASKGRSGGWIVTCDLSQVTLLDIHEAVGSPELFAIGSRNQASTCLIEKAVNSALSRSIQEAQALLLERFAGITLAQLHTDFRSDMEALMKRRATSRRGATKNKTRRL